MTNTSDIQIYVADLAAYNSGYLHGVWIDATQDPEDIKTAIQDMLTLSPVEDSEEYAIHDYEGFEGVHLDEYDSIETVHHIACFIEEHGALGAGILNHCCDDLEQAGKVLEEAYRGCYTSLADFAQELTEETAEVPAHLAFYIDYDRMGRDMDMSGDIFTIETAHDEVHVFWNF